MLRFFKLTVIFFFYFLFIILFNYFSLPFHSPNLFVNQFARRLKMQKCSKTYFANLVFYFSLLPSQLLAHTQSNSKLPSVCHVMWCSVLPFEGEIRNGEKMRTFLNGMFRKVHKRKKEHVLFWHIFLFCEIFILYQFFH